mgnify:CR=1 FL=1
MNSATGHLPKVSFLPAVGCSSGSDAGIALPAAHSRRAWISSFVTTPSAKADGFSSNPSQRRG